MKRIALTAVGLVAVGVLALAQVGKKAEGGAQSPSYTGSIPVKEGQDYKALAKIDAQEAVRAAQAALGTTESPTKVALEDENGYLVWEVVLAGQEVKVDAGTGQVLHKEAYTQEKGGGEHEEAQGGSEGEHEGNEVEGGEGE